MTDHPTPRWHVARRAHRECPWVALFDGVDVLGPDDRAAHISGGEHETWAEAFAAAAEGAALTATRPSWLWLS